MITNFLGILGRERAPFLNYPRKTKNIFKNKRNFYLLKSKQKIGKIFINSYQWMK